LKLKTAVCAAAVTCLVLVPGLSDAKGCLKGAAVGGIGGHFAGHHGLIGAAAGCAVGVHMANKKQAATASTGTNATPTPTTQPAPQAPTRH
jgi:hypothetical protein